MIVIPWFALGIFFVALGLITYPGLAAYYKLKEAQELAGETVLMLEFKKVREELEKTRAQVKDLTQKLSNEQLLRQKIEERVEALEEENRGLSSENGKLVIQNKHLQELLVKDWTGAK